MARKVLNLEATQARQPGLFDRSEYESVMEKPAQVANGKPRFKFAQRQQVQFRAVCWNDLLPLDHQARAVWSFVEGLDLSVLTSQSKAVEGRAGASRIDVRILMALWLYATLRGMSSAREFSCPRKRLGHISKCDATRQHVTMFTQSGKLGVVASKVRSRSAGFVVESE